MLAEPNDESPANVDAAKQWRESYPEFKRRVARCVRKSQEEQNNQFFFLNTTKKLMRKKSVIINNYNLKKKHNFCSILFSKGKTTRNIYIPNVYMKKKQEKNVKYH